MRSLNEYITLNESGEQNLRPNSALELKKLIGQRIKEQGPNCDLNDIDVSHITDMSFLFCKSNFNGDISQWDVSNVKDMSGMFAWSTFNGDISNWNTSNVFDMELMFYRSEFNGDISRWNVTNVEDMCCTFLESRFNGDISNWNVCTYEMTSMFRESELEVNGKIPTWYKE